MKMFDSHAHYDDAKFSGRADEILCEVHGNGVEKITNIGCSLASSRASLSLAAKYDFIYAAVGVHPSDAVSDMKNEDWLEQVEAMYHSSPKAVAIGEIGLDYHYGKDDIAEQKICFRLQLELARRLGAPVVIHDREAHEDTLEILYDFPEVTAVLHSFSGSYEMAREIIKRGHYISVNGVVTFSNAKKTADILERLDSIAPYARERLLMETDCPYLTPTPHRGELNRSDYMVFTAERAGSLLGISGEEFARLTYENACRFYGIEQ